MHPNVFLKSLWRLEVRPEIFVAMSFADKYTKRYEDVIPPAIRSISASGETLQPNRVDLSKSGNSLWIATRTWLEEFPAPNSFSAISALVKAPILNSLNWLQTSLPGKSRFWPVNC